LRLFKQHGRRVGFLLLSSFINFHQHHRKVDTTLLPAHTPAKCK
jgi:hypothetical protein